MKIKYLSDEWFAKVEELTEEVNLQVSDKVGEMKLNLTVIGEDGGIDFSINGGIMKKGHLDDAKTSLTIPQKYAYKMLILHDTSIGTTAFNNGELKVDGDESMLASLLDVQPTESEKLLAEQLKEMTAE